MTSFRKTARSACCSSRYTGRRRKGGGRGDGAVADAGAAGRYVAFRARWRLPFHGILREMALSWHRPWLPHKAIMYRHRMSSRQWSESTCLRLLLRHGAVTHLDSLTRTPRTQTHRHTETRTHAYTHSHRERLARAEAATRKPFLGKKEGKKRKRVHRSVLEKGAWLRRRTVRGRGKDSTWNKNSFFLIV